MLYLHNRITPLVAARRVIEGWAGFPWASGPVGSSQYQAIRETKRSL